VEKIVSGSQCAANQMYRFRVGADNEPDGRSDPITGAIPSKLPERRTGGLSRRLEG
jgi:hypothetical protein